METLTTLAGRDSPAQHFLIAAIGKAGGVSPNSLSLPFDVVLTVNGLELPFSKTIDDIYNRFEKQLEERVEARAMEIAKDLVGGAKLDSLSDALRKAEEIIEEALQKALSR